MSKKSKSPHNNPPAQPHRSGAEQYERHISGDIRVRGEIEAQVPPNLIDKHDAERKEDNAQNNKTFVVNALTLIAVVIYAGLTAWQGCLTRTAIKDAREHFIADQRPYIWKIVIKTVPVQPNERLCEHLFFANYGKTPAINRKGRAKVFFGPSAMQNADQWFQQLGSERFSDNETGSETVEPPSLPSQDPEKSNASYTTVCSDSTIGPNDITYMRTHDHAIVVVDREQYFDLSANFHWSDMCSASLATGIMSACRHHNEIH